MFSWNLLRTKLLWGLHTMNGITASPNFSMKSNAFSIKSHMEIFLYSRFCCLLVTGQSRTFRKEMGIFLMPEIRALSVKTFEDCSLGVEKKERERIYYRSRQISAS